MKTALTIAGSDASGGAGIQADLKTMMAHGVYGMSAITALTAQNTTGIRAIEAVTPEFLAAQIDAVFEDIRPDAVKIGMVFTSANAAVIAERLRYYEASNIVIDPVMISSSGTRLLEEDTIQICKKQLFPLATLLTPNLPEAQALSGIRLEGLSPEETDTAIAKAAEQLSQEYGCAILIKGGHSSRGADDYLYQNGRGICINGTRIDNPNTHGTGCTLSSAIASNLAKQESLEDAVRDAKTYMNLILSANLNLGAGPGPMDHGFVMKTQ